MLAMIGAVVVLGCLLTISFQLARIVHLLRKLISLQAETNALTTARVVRSEIEH